MQGVSTITIPNIQFTMYVHSIVHSTKAKTQSTRTGTFRYCSAMHRSIYIAWVQGLPQCTKIVLTYATKLLYT